MKNMITTVFKAIALAMGVAVIVLSILNEIDTSTAIKFLAIGLTGSGFAHVMEIKKNETK